MRYAHSDRDYLKKAMKQLYGRPPAEAEMQQYFNVPPPSEHHMILTLERNGLITRIPGMPRSIRLNLTRPELIELLSSLLLETGEDGMGKRSVAE